MTSRDAPSVRARSTWHRASVTAAKDLLRSCDRPRLMPCLSSLTSLLTGLTFPLASRGRPATCEAHSGDDTPRVSPAPPAGRVPTTRQRTASDIGTPMPGVRLTDRAGTTRRMRSPGEPGRPRVHEDTKGAMGIGERGAGWFDINHLPGPLVTLQGQQRRLTSCRRHGPAHPTPRSPAGASAPARGAHRELIGLAARIARVADTRPRPSTRPWPSPPAHGCSREEPQRRRRARGSTGSGPGSSSSG